MKRYGYEKIDIVESFIKKMKANQQAPPKTKRVRKKRKHMGDWSSEEENELFRDRKNEVVEKFGNK